MRGVVSELDNQRNAKKEKERLAQQINIMSGLWSDGKGLLAKTQNFDFDSATIEAEAQAWLEKVIAWLKGDWNKPSDANYFVDCDDGSDNIQNPFPLKVLEQRNKTYRGLHQRVRNLRVILDREIARRP